MSFGVCAAGIVGVPGNRMVETVMSQAHVTSIEALAAWKESLHGFAAEGRKR